MEAILIARLSQEPSAAATGIDSQETTPSAATEEPVRKAACIEPKQEATAPPDHFCEPDVDSCESAKNSPRQEGDEDVTGKTADPTATGIDPQGTTPGTVVAAASTDNADTTAKRSLTMVLVACTGTEKFTTAQTSSDTVEAIDPQGTTAHTVFGNSPWSVMLGLAP